MEIDTKVGTLETNAVFSETTRSGISDEAMPFVISLLTDLYKSPYLAIAREYLSNAVDAVIASMGTTTSFGIVFDRPIEVTLPSRLNPHFIIRDHGTGMSREVLTKIYPEYGLSTKRKTNAQIGGFGLGAKSALSIATGFVVTTVHEGKKNVAILQKGEDGVSVNNFLAEEDTTEANGTVVTLTLPEPDRLTRLFRDSNLLLGFPKNSVSLNGVVHTNSVYDEDKYTQIGDSGWVSNGLIDWQNVREARLTKNYNEKLVLVGPISYTVPVNELAGYPREFHALDDFTILNLPIGSVDVTPARDSLMFTPKTQNAILTATRKLHNELNAHLSDKVANAANRREAIEIVSALNIAGFKADWKYKNDVVPSLTVKPYENASNFYTAGGFKSRVKDYTNHTQVLGRNAVLVYGVEDKIEAQSLNRYRRAFEQRLDGVSDSFNLIFTTAKKKDLGKWAKAQFVAVLSVEDFTEKGVMYRKEVNEAKRAERSANATTSQAAPVGTLPMSLLHAAHGSDRPGLDSRPADFFTGYDHVVYLQTDAVNTGTLVHRMAEAITNPNSNRSLLRTLNQAMPIITKFYGAEGETVKIVRIPAGTKLSNVQTVLTNLVSFDEALTASLAKYLAAGARYTAEAVSFRKSEQDIDWTADFTQDDLNQIQDEALRNWVSKAKENSRLSYTTRRQMSEFITVIEDEVFASHFAEFNAQVQRVEHYSIPLLASLDSYSTRDAAVRAEVVDYLNFKFSS